MSLAVVIASVLSTKVTALPVCQPPKTWEYGWYETYVQSGHLCSPFQWGEQYVRTRNYQEWKNGVRNVCTPWVFDECEGGGNPNALPPCPASTCVGGPPSGD